MSRRASAFVAIGSLLAAISCVSSSSGPAGEPTAASLPCDVRTVLEQNCQRCHASPPRFGAPMPLVTWADTQASTPGQPSKKVFTRIGEAIHDPVAPMPQGGRLAAADTAVLDAWIAAGAPSGTGACTADGGAEAGPPTGPDYLPCPPAERTTFLAHGDTPAAPFPVAKDAGNLYQCFTWRAPWTATAQATAFAPVIDDARVIHHWILFETAVPQTDGGAGPCRMPADARFLEGWAPGGENRIMPADVGLALPQSDRFLILQVHYWNAAGYADARDRSGVAMCTTTSLRPKTAVVSTLGTAGIDLPPRSTGTKAAGMCTPVLTEPMHVLATAPHMHRLGRSIRTEVLRGGSESAVESLVDVQRWDFELQHGYPSELIVQPGDKLRTTCTYDNPTDRRVTFGEKTEDEMCFDFVTVWPAPGLLNEGGRAAQRCVDR